MIRTTHEDGSVHFTDLKTLSLSGKKYLHSCNTPTVPTKPMRRGSVVHFLTLGPRPTAKPFEVFDGIRRGKVWDAFRLEHIDKEIVSITEWAEAMVISAALKVDPIAQRRLAGARLEVPLTWSEGGIRCSTSGIDIIPTDGGIGDLKVPHTTYPATFQSHAFKMLWPQQLAFYRRGAMANGIDVSKGLFLLGIEPAAPYEVVELDLTERMIDFADRSVSLWFERLRNYRLSCPEPTSVHSWPGYSEAPVPFDIPKWAEGRGEDEEDEGDDEANAEFAA